MESDYSFLQFLIEEPVYRIQEKNEQKNTAAPITPAPSINSSESVKVNKSASKKILIGASIMSDSSRDFLYKILAAVKVNPDDAIIQVCSNYSELNHQEANKVILFGLNLPSENIPLYTPSKFQSQEVLIAEDLLQIEMDVNKKKSLWQALQKIFL